MQKSLLLIILLCLFIILNSCMKEEEEKIVEYIKITPREAQEMMLSQDATKSVIILDVRTQEEFESGHIPSAVLLPDFEVRKNAEYVIPDKDKIIIVYCQRGGRSKSASKALIEMGYTNVFDLGSILDWDGDLVTGR